MCKTFKKTDSFVYLDSGQITLAPSSEMDGFYVACLERKVSVIIELNLFNILYFTYSITVCGKGKAIPSSQE